MRYKALLELYRRKKINKNGLKKAVADGVITKDQYKEITGQDYA
jgi:hypothetical protein